MKWSKGFTPNKFYTQSQWRKQPKEATKKEDNIMVVGYRKDKIMVVGCHKDKMWLS
jgi:hypothetical protein